MNNVFTKILTLIVLAACSIGLTAKAQNTTTYSNANYSLRTWDIGLNMGATWEQSDIDKNFARLGWGFTVGKYWLRKSNKVFDIGLRFRYLVGNARGQDFHPNYGLKYNTTLNGTFDPNVNYYTDSTRQGSSHPFAYNNYKMISNEFSMELMLGANRLRQKTGILLYVFGGGGFFYSKTTTNQLNGEGTLFDQPKMYDYTTIDPNSGNTAIMNQLTSMQDKSYETKTEGQHNDGWVLCPTLGIGIGKMLSKSTAIGIEHKITFPLHDYLDGQMWTNNNSATGTNDWQHYTGFYIRWYFRARGEYNNNTYTQHTDQTNYTNNNHDPYTPPHDNGTGNTNPPPPPPSNARPVITITFPGGSPYTHNSNNITVTGSVLNATSRNEITVKVNGFNVSNFTYDTYSKAISISTLLNQGTNVVDITATNNAGSDHKEQIINYTDANSWSGAPPTVTINQPGTNPFTTSSTSVGVVATVTNVSAQNQITVTY